jgi:hypothetical protein
MDPDLRIRTTYESGALSTKILLDYFCLLFTVGPLHQSFKIHKKLFRCHNRAPSVLQKSSFLDFFAIRLRTGFEIVDIISDPVSPKSNEPESEHLFL